MDAPEAEKDSSLPAVPRQKKVSTSEDHFILFKVLIVMARHLNLDIIGTWLFQGEAISDSDDIKLTRMRDSPNFSRADTVKELARMIHRNGTLEQFITALKESSLHNNPGHTTVLEAIKEKQEEVTNGRHTGSTHDQDPFSDDDEKDTPSPKPHRKHLNSLTSSENPIPKQELTSTHQDPFASDKEKHLPDTHQGGSVPRKRHTKHKHENSPTLAPPPTPDSADNGNPSHNNSEDRSKNLEPPVDCDNVMHITDPSLFETMPPYRYFEVRPRRWIEFVIAVFIVYQMLASIVITLCEEHCLYRVFRNDMPAGVDWLELVRRMCLFTLRVAVRTILPFVFYRQVCRLADGERSYLKQLPNKSSSKQQPPHSSSSLNDTPSSQTDPSPTPTHHRPHHCVTVTLWESIVPHAILFSGLLFYIGAFLVAEDRLLRRNICIREVFQIEVPFLSMQVYQFFDCLAVFFMLMVVGILKDCYCLENNSTAAIEHYEIMRKRWIRIDMFCYITPFCLAIFTAFMFAYGNPLVPEPPDNMDMDQLIVWCFWMMALTLLQFCGSAAGKFLKACCIIGHIFCFLFIHLFTNALNVEKIYVPPGSAVILLYTTVAVTLFNFLWCLMRCHLRAKGWRSKRFQFSVVCLVVLLFSLLATAIREAIHFAYFVLIL